MGRKNVKHVVSEGLPRSNGCRPAAGVKVDYRAAQDEYIIVAVAKQLVVYCSRPVSMKREEERAASCSLLLTLCGAVAADPTDTCCNIQRGRCVEHAHITYTIKVAMLPSMKVFNTSRTWWRSDGQPLFITSVKHGACAGLQAAVCNLASPYC
jgi:hypothetical protein